MKRVGDAELADPQLVYPVGMMMLMLVALSVPFHLAKQSQIIAMIIVGVVFGPGVYLFVSAPSCLSMCPCGRVSVCPCVCLSVCP